MASIELSPIQDHFEEDLVQELEEALADADASPLDVDEDAESILLDSDIDDDLIAEIMDRLEMHDAAADIYVPPDFEEVFEIGGYRIASAHMLTLVLQEMRDELFLDDDEEDGAADELDDEYDYGEENTGAADDGDVEEPFEFKEKQLRHVWRLLHSGARVCVKRGVCLFIHQ